jgi:autotransporter-associated beta strand protein
VTETGPGSLTLSGTQTYTGPTAIAGGSLTLSGALPPSDITNNGSLTLAPTASQTYGNVISGPGAISVNASAVLSLSGTNLFTGNLTNNSGFLILSNNSAAGSGTIVYNGGFVVAAANTVITNNFTIPGTSASDLCMMASNSGTATWAGNVNVGGSAQWRPGSDGGSLTFLGNAVMGSHIFIVPRGSMTFAANAVASSTISGYLGRDSSGNKRSLNLTVRDNASVSMAGCSFGGGKTGGSITVTVQNNGLLSLGSVDLHNINNTAAISTLRLNGGTTTVGGFTKTDTGGTNVIAFNGGVLTASANNAAFLPALTASTNVVQAGGAIVNDGGYLIAIAGRLTHDPGLGATADGGLTKFGAGTLTLAANNTYTGPTVINAGTLSIYAPPLGSISNSASVNIAAGAVFDFWNGGTGALALGSGQTISGNGAIHGNLTVGNAAILAPGSNSIGTLTFSNSLTLASGSTNIFAVSHSPLGNDSAVIYGALTNGGTLIVTNIGGTQLAAGDTFQLFNAGSYSGAFSSVVLPTLPFGLAWNLNNLNTTGTISVVLNTVPVIGSISVSGSTLSLSGTGGVGNAYYVLIGTTNLSTPSGNWTPLLTNQFDSSGNFNFTTNANTGNPQNFYRLQLQ